MVKKISAFLESLLDNENETVDKFECLVLLFVIAYFTFQIIRVAI